MEINESSMTKNTVISLFQAIVKDDSICEPQLKNVFRLKRSDKVGVKDHYPVMKVTFVHKHERKLFLTNARFIKNNKDLDKELQKIIVSPDLTAKQRRENKNLRKEFNEKNNESGGMNFTIRNWKIVPKMRSAAAEAGSEAETPSGWKF